MFIEKNYDFTLIANDQAYQNIKKPEQGTGVHWHQELPQ